jgi:integrase
LGELRDVYYEAVANGVAETNPATHIKPLKQQRIRKRLTIDTWNLMLEKALDSTVTWISHMLLLALATGQRRGDLAKMRFDDVVDGCLRIEQQKKAGKPIGARLAIPLEIKLNATGFSLGEIVDFCRIGSTGDTLLRKSNGGSIEVSSLSSRFHELITNVLGEDAYSIYEWPSLHEVRSLSARTYLLEGMPSSTVQTLMGHKNEDMTKIYLDDRGLSEKEWKKVE